MFFPSTTSAAALIAWCRALRHGISAGLPLLQLFRQQASKGPVALRAVADRLANRLEQGESLEDALKLERDRFPPLFCDLASVGERTGHLPEVFRELEDYFTLQRQMRHKFLSDITWPVFQFVVAILVIALLIWVLGWIAESHGTEPIQPIGMGLSGASGAMIFLAGVAGILLALFLGYRFASRHVRHWAAVEGALLRVPAIGPCLDAIAMQRFCLCLRMTMEVGLSVPQAVRRSLRATGNRAFTRHEERVGKDLRRGEDLTSTLTRTGVFTEEFIQALAVGEESGQIPEVMERQSEYYREESSRRLAALTKAAGFGVWLLVAIFLIIAIFRIAGIYFGALAEF